MAEHNTSNVELKVTNEAALAVEPRDDNDQQTEQTITFSSNNAKLYAEDTDHWFMETIGTSEEGPADVGTYSGSALDDLNVTENNEFTDGTNTYDLETYEIFLKKVTGGIKVTKNTI